MEGEVYIPTDNEVAEAERVAEQGRKEHYRKISEYHKGKPVWNKGVPWSEEVKRKISISEKGKAVSEETRKKLSETHKGIPSKYKGIKGRYHHSKEIKIKIGEANKGKIVSKETRRILSELSKGRPNYKTRGSHRTEEVKRKMREAQASSFHKQSKPERMVRDELTRLGKSPSLHPKGIKGLDLGDYKGHCFDISLEQYKIAIEVNGCNVHGCSVCFPTPNEWQKRAMKRDQVIREAFKKQSEWTLIEIWEHDIKSDMSIEYILKKTIPQLFMGEI